MKTMLAVKGLADADFLKTASALGVFGALASLPDLPSMPKPFNKALAAKSVTHDSFPVEIVKEYQRFDFKNVIFMRGTYEEKLLAVGKTWREKSSNPVPPAGKTCWTELDQALAMAAWSVQDHAAPRNSAGIPQAGPLYSWNYPSNSHKTTFKSLEEAAKVIKKAAIFLGASLVGICDYDERWVYSNWYNPATKQSIPVKFSFEPMSVIVLALEMDYEAFKTAPSLIEQAATAKEYSRMATISHQVATFCRELGYHAANCGNDTAMSVPLAIAAGIGELSRMGLIITPQYGPRIRLCKVFTDLPLKADKPISFGVMEFCKVCLKCAGNCPSTAINRDTEPSYDI